MAAKPLTLRCKTRNGQFLVESLTGESSVEDLKAVIFSLTGISISNLRVLVGYPPRQLNLSNDSEKLDSLLLQSKETLIIEEVPCDNRKEARIPQTSRLINETIMSNTVSSKNVGSNDSSAAASGILIRRSVAANNSCLFTSIYFALSGGEYNENVGSALRQIIAETVAGDSETFNEAFLGKPNREYCTWILNEEHWGGGIEISILSKYYGIEIVAVDTLNVRLNRFGEDSNYPERILLIYDGIHYDPLLLEPLDNSQPVQTVFQTSDNRILEMSLELAREAKASRQFTDVRNFSLRCLVCNSGFTGQQQAQNHAKETGHTNFGEI